MFHQVVRYGHLGAWFPDCKSRQGDVIGQTFCRGQVILAFSQSRFVARLMRLVQRSLVNGVFDYARN